MQRLNISRLREALAKVSPEQAARELGVSTYTVANWMSGATTPRADALPIIAAFARKSVGWLFTREAA